MTKFEKDLTIAELVMDAAISMCDNIAKAFPTKKLFRKDKYDRSPGKRQKRKLAKLKLMRGPINTAVQIENIVSIPNRIYPPGGLFYGTAQVGNKNIVGETVYTKGPLVDRTIKFNELGNEVYCESKLLPIIKAVNDMKLSEKYRHKI